MNLESILKNLVTSGIGLSDPDLSRKFVVLNIFQLFIIMLTPLLGLFYFYIGAMFLFNAAIISGFLMALGIFILRKTKNITISGNYAVFVLWAFLSVISYKTGAMTVEGIINPSWLLNAGLILFSIFINGYKSGTIWAMIIFIETGVIIYLFRSGYQFVNMIPPDLTSVYFMGVYLCCLLIILLFAILFEREKNEAFKREQEKSNTIRESKKYMDSIFDRYPLPTFVLDRRHRVIQWNRACVEVSGISCEGILGKEVWEGFRINEQGSVADIILEDIDSINDIFKDEIMSSDKEWIEINTCLPGLKDGTKAIITAAPILDDSGMIKGAIQTIQDLKQISAETGDGRDLSEGKFPEPVFKIDENGKISFWNESCKKLLGYDPEDILGKSPLVFVAKNYREIFKNAFIKAVKGEQFSPQEFRYTSASGKPVYVKTKIFSGKGPENEILECIVINTDITELRLKLKKLRKIAAESNERYKGLSEEYDLLKKNIANFIRKKEDDDGE